MEADKLMALADAVEAIKVPEVSAEMQAVAHDVEVALAECVESIRIIVACRAPQ